jgi:hypothetical protein
MHPRERQLLQRDDYGPVTLIYCDAPPWQPQRRLAMIQSKDCKSNANALALASDLFKTDHFFNPFVIDEEGRSIWVEHELRKRCIG